MVVLFNKCNGAVVHPFVANTPICLTNNRAVVRQGSRAHLYKYRWALPLYVFPPR